MGRHLAAGALAGAAGTTVLNAIGYLDMAVRGRPASEIPERAVDVIADRLHADLGEGETAHNRQQGLGPMLGVLLLPGASPERTRARAADPAWVAMLANTARTQAVRVPSLGITAVNFWNDGTTGGLTASAPCAVLVRERGDGTAALTVSDPRCDLDELTLTWDRPVAGVLDRHPLLDGAATGARLALRFGRLADLDGGSVTVTVRLADRV
ncbi:polysaccharide lyase beta-sandwich domain-containing protein [Microtetraspora fusca]|uniref:polysaccharide lyase beta-sandwich domain-containing protein n=1 Tax=Microtetraspora fusca TaxID=1997 RepID=UPI00082A973C|nr:polysaccharide lyase beta-sandwich domain-containing protein [Microtetraspora fusca]